MSHALKSNTIAGGVFVDLGKKIVLNAGFVYVMYADYTNSALSYEMAPLFPNVPYSDTYSKNTTIFAIGLGHQPLAIYTLIERNRLTLWGGFFYEKKPGGVPGWIE